MIIIKKETIADALNNVDKIFLLTLPAPDMTDIYSNLVKEAKKNDVKYIVKLSVREPMLNLETQLVAYIDRKKESYRNLGYHIASCVQLHLCKTL